MKVEYIKNIGLKTIKKFYKGNKMLNGRFCELSAYADSLSKLIYLMITEIITPRFSNKTKFIPAKSISDFKFTNSENFCVWLGHSSFYICINGIYFITDPCFFSIPFLKRKVKIPFNLDEIKKVDYVLISHFHPDHCDIKSIQKIIDVNSSVEFLTGLNCDKYLKKIKSNIQTASWYQKYDTDSKIEIYYMPSRHCSGNSLLDLNKSLWGSFIIKANNKVFYFTGDTGYDVHLKEIKEQFPKIDYCFMELSWQEKISVNGHLHPSYFSKFYNDLKPEIIIPMHYGTYHKPLIRNPIEDIKKEVQKIGISDKFKIMKIGEKIKL